jgi:four helix bundle protein
LKVYIVISKDAVNFKSDSMQNYRDLEVFKEAKRLAIQIHKISLTLPKFELYEVRRSSKAIASLIVEGYARKRYKADFVKYLVYALGECDETILHLEFLFETKSFKDEEVYHQLRKEYEVLCKRLNSYLKWVEDSWNP